MKSQRSVKVIFDTNIWISFLIGKRLRSIQEYIAEKTIIIIFTDQILTELTETTKRPKLLRYFAQDKVHDLISFLKMIGEYHPIKNHNHFPQDPKDSFLLDLIEKSQADYLVTGDRALLGLKQFSTATIIKAAEFEREMSRILHS